MMPPPMMAIEALRGRVNTLIINNSEGQCFMHRIFSARGVQAHHNKANRDGAKRGFQYDLGLTKIRFQRIL